jgi:excinuclease ABC subunit A
VFAGDEDATWRWSTGLHCPESDLRYADPQPALFSFNSAFGACETCRGFGRVIGVDWGLVIPDDRKTCATAPSSRCRRRPGRTARTTC